MEAVLEAAEAGAEFAGPLVVPAAVETDADVGTETPEELVTVVLSPPLVPMRQSQKHLELHWIFRWMKKSLKRRRKMMMMMMKW